MCLFFKRPHLDLIVFAAGGMEVWRWREEACIGGLEVAGRCVGGCGVDILCLAAVPQPQSSPGTRPLILIRGRDETRDQRPASAGHGDTAQCPVILTALIAEAEGR